jgi:aerobic-type carbon monoxide dehydrogenase small subunit (CoxS/CutS family)
VLVDGVPEFSCQVTLGEFAGRAITTARGLAATPEGRSVQEALSSYNAGQCGYCLAGIAVTLTFLAGTDGPVDERMLVRWLDEHLCRCGSHQRIMRAARAVVSSS